MDDDLLAFEADGTPPLPPGAVYGVVDHAGARIWYASVGSGPAVLLLHGALGNSADWGHQLRPLISAGYQPIVLDNRGRGRSTMGSEPLSYELMAREVLAVMDALAIERAAIAGWSDGAIIALVLALQHPSRVEKVFAFAGNMDLTAVKSEMPSGERLTRVFRRASKDYARLSSTPQAFKAMTEAVNAMMRTQPNYTAADLAAIRTPVAIVTGETDEFLKREHMEYLAHTIPGARLVVLPGVSHFAPLQRPELFNGALLAFLGGGSPQ